MYTLYISGYSHAVGTLKRLDICLLGSLFARSEDAVALCLTHGVNQQTTSVLRSITHLHTYVVVIVIKASSDINLNCVNVLNNVFRPEKTLKKTRIKLYNTLALQFCYMAVKRGLL